MRGTITIKHTFKDNNIGDCILRSKYHHETFMFINVNVLKLAALPRHDAAWYIFFNTKENSWLLFFICIKRIP